MSDKNKKISRREFIRSAGVTGIGSLLALSSGLVGNALAQEAKKEEKKETPTEEKKMEIPKMPTRTFGKTGVPVSILCLGGITDWVTNQILLKKALDWGITYWDTANGYNGGNSELGIGNFFGKFPEARKKIFLVTKGGAKSPAELTRMLNLSLERMKTDYIDLYFMHGMDNINVFTPEIKTWAENAKKEKKIKFFGFSTHSNMANCLANAATLGWIDGIMLTYNYQVMFKEDMKKAVEACNKAGIGLTAMKTQAGRSKKGETPPDFQFAEKFIQKGYTPEQAKLKVVWENAMIASICSAMFNLTVLSSNFAAAVDKTRLELSDLSLFKTYAEATCSGYCAGCAEICNRAMGEEAHIAEVMRSMMYYHSYGDAVLAREQFNQIPEEIRSRMSHRDYSRAEEVCPHKIAIGKLVKEASKILA